MKDKIVFFGRNKNYNITHLCYKELIKFIRDTQHEIVMTVISDDDHGDPDTLESLAENAGVPWTSPPSNDVNDPIFVKKLTELNPTIFITVQFPKIFKSEVLNIPKRGALNIHRGWPLRGGSIDERAIYYRASQYNVILHHMTPGIDTGNIIGKVGFELSDNEDGYSLVKKADEAGRKLFVKYFLPLIGYPLPFGEKQDLEMTTYGDKGSLSNKIDFSESSDNIERICRAFHHPRKLGAFIMVMGQKIYPIPPLKVIPESSKENPGTILALTESSVVLATGDSKMALEKCHLGDKVPIHFGQFLIKKGFNVGDSLVS